MIIILIGIVILCIFFGVKYQIAQANQRKEDARKKEELTELALKIEKLKPVAYTEKQLERINAIESKRSKTSGFLNVSECFEPAGKELLCIIELTTHKIPFEFGNSLKTYWLAVFDDEVLPSKECSKDLHIYPVARKDFTKFYSIFTMPYTQKGISTSTVVMPSSHASVTKRAVAGAVIGGGVGAVIGAASAIEKNSRGPVEKTTSTIQRYECYGLAIQSHYLDNNNLLSPIAEGHILYVRTQAADAIKFLCPHLGKQSEKYFYLYEDCGFTDAVKHPHEYEKEQTLRYLLDNY